MLWIRTKRPDGTYRSTYLNEEEIRSVYQQLVTYGLSLEEILQYFTRVSGKPQKEVALVLGRVPRLAACLS